MVVQVFTNCIICILCGSDNIAFAWQRHVQYTIQTVHIQSKHALSGYICIHKTFEYTKNPTPSLCNTKQAITCPTSALSRFYSSSLRTRRQHINHTTHTPCYLACFDHHLNSLHQLIKKQIDLFTPSQLVGVKIEHDECNVSR